MVGTWKSIGVIALFAAEQSVAEVKRARDWGISLEGVPGEFNAITDVPGVAVGHCTIISGSGSLEIGRGPVRTGVTAILPTGRDYRPVFASHGSLNGNGEFTGTDWIEESGFLEEPILFTSTHSVGIVYESSIQWRRERRFHNSTSETGWASLPVVGETWDGRLNDIHGHHVKREHVFEALDGARGGPIAEGSVGGGTGMVCHRFKAGIGTSS
ncbi:MAG: P1 family peptidase, partial [Verrucomicrobiota bacterium]